ncbi:MAG: DnaD domain protein [Lachnospiraceae bacterium]|nr:DnaD domain protein [Lachnospiraceae bacterium]
MDDIRLRMISLKSRTTAVPDVFIDEYMAGADGEFVKVYLYLLRSLTKEEPSFSVSEMADVLGHTERDITRALKFWEKKGLVCLEFDSRHSLTGISMMDLSGGGLSSGAETERKKQEEPKSRETAPSEIEKGVSQEEDLMEVLKCTEFYMKRPLSPTETQKFYSWYKDLSMSPELISYLIESCIESGHADFSYMDAVALKWAKAGYRTPEEAESGGKVYSSTMKTVTKAFGIYGRSLAPVECEYINRWSKEYGFSDNIILEACRRTILSAGKASFPYAESMLKNWHDKGFSTLEMIEDNDRSRLRPKSYGTELSIKKSPGAKTQSSFPERKYDFDALETRLLNQS